MATDSGQPDVRTENLLSGIKAAFSRITDMYKDCMLVAFLIHHRLLNIDIVSQRLLCQNAELHTHW